MNQLGFCFAVVSPALATQPTEPAPVTAPSEPAPSDAPVAPETVRPNELEAERVFREARELLKQGKYEEACPKLEESHRLDPALGTLLNLGVCYEESGRVASAWRVYRRVASQARELAQFEREALAEERVAALEPELPRIVLDFGGALPISVSLNDQPLPSGIWDRPLLVDPGTYLVEVRSARHGVWKQQVQVARAQYQRVVVPLLAPAAAAPTAPHSEQQLGRLSDDRSKDSGQAPARNIAIVLGGLGGGAAIAGTVFGILAYSNHASSEDECGPRGACTSKGRDLRDKALDQAAVSTVAFGIAAASVTGALALWFTAPKPTATRSAVRFNAAASPAHLQIGTAVDF
jgi:serine/threonine-protein kinase